MSRPESGQSARVEYCNGPTPDDPSNDPGVQKLDLIRQFQRKVRREGIRVEYNAFHDPVLLRGRITQITEYRIKIRLHEPRYWRISLCTWIEWQYTGYQAFAVDLDNQTVEISPWAWTKVTFLVQLAWIRAKHSRQT